MLLVLLYRLKSHFSPLSWRPLVTQSTITKLESEETRKTCFWEYLAAEKHVTGSGIMAKNAMLPTLAYHKGQIYHCFSQTIPSDTSIALFTCNIQMFHQLIHITPAKYYTMLQGQNLTSSNKLSYVKGKPINY